MECSLLRPPSSKRVHSIHLSFPGPTVVLNTCLLFFSPITVKYNLRDKSLFDTISDYDQSLWESHGDRNLKQ